MRKKVAELWGCTRSYYWSNVTSVLVVALAAWIALSITLILTGVVKDRGDQIAMIGYILTVFAIFHASSQFRANHDWNRRDAAMIAMKSRKEETRHDVLILDEAFNYIRRRTDDKITTEQIHQRICVTDPKSGKFIRDEHDKLVIDHSQREDEKASGAEVKKALINLLNSCEHLATGVIQGNFDETAVHNLDGGIIISVYYIFQDYICHLNKEMYPERDGKIYENLKYLAEKFREKEEDEKSRVKEREKTA